MYVISPSCLFQKKRSGAGLGRIEAVAREDRSFTPQETVCTGEKQEGAVLGRGEEPCWGRGGFFQNYWE